MYKMLTIDIDDTLINSDLIITEVTKAALTAAIDSGVIVTLATGRMYASAKEIAKQLDLNVPLITYQGALIKNLLDGQVLYERFVPQQMTEYIFNYAAKHGLFVQSYYDDKLYVTEENQRAIDYSNIVGIPYIVESDLQKIAALPTAKLLFIDEPSACDELAVQLHEQIGDQVHLTKSKPNYLEIVHLEATKGRAIQFLARHYGIDVSQVISIGDSWNDIEMIETAGLGIAMGNAVDALKEVADYITLSNNEDGVKHAVDKFILHK